MKTFLLLVLLAFVASLATATRGSISQDLFDDDVKDDEQELIDDGDESLDVKTERRRNPCILKKCKRGETCTLNKDNEAECVCNPDCSFYVQNNPRYKVCSTSNVTYETECHLDQDHCRCKRQLESCSNPDKRKVHLEYYGGCMEFGECTEGQAEQFPERMKEWLFIVMEEMDRRSEMDGYQDLLDTARQDENHTMAVVWKFCDLDKDPQDRVVSRRELQYMVRTLRVLENCFVPFLDKCDDNDDRKISLVEWGDCLGMDHEKITDKCHAISKKGKKKKSKK